MGRSLKQRLEGSNRDGSNMDRTDAQTARFNFKNHFVAMSGEFVGTFLFLFFAFSCHTMAVEQAGDTGPNGTNSASTVIYISLGYGFSLLVTAWTLYRVSGGLFNPA